MTSVPESIRVLVLEDQPLDMELMLRELRHGGYEPDAVRVETEEAFAAALVHAPPDVVLSDFSLPTFDGLSALRVAAHVAPDVPVIIVTGSIGEEVAVECIKAGAADYLIKDRMGRLPAAVRSALERRRAVLAQHRAESEIRKLTTAIEQSPVSVVMTGTDGLITYVNRRFTEVTGYAAHEVMGRNPRILQSGHSPREAYRSLWAALTAGQPWSGDFINRRKDGTVFWESASISPVSDAGGTVTSYIAVKEDVTDRRRRERELAAIAGVGAEVDRALHTRAANREEFVHRALDVVLRALDAHGAAVIAHRPSTGGYHVLAARGEWSGSTGMGLARETGPLREVQETGTPWLGEGGLLGHRLAGRSDRPRTWSMLGVRLSGQGRTLGTLWAARDLARPDAAPFLPWDLPVLEAAAMVLGAGMHEFQLTEQTNSRLARLLAMQEIDQAIASSLDPRVTLNVVLDNVMSQLGADACDVLLLNPHLRVLEFAAGRGFARGQPPPGPLPVGQGLAGLAVLERRLVTDADRPGDGAHAPAHGDPFRTHHIVPLVTKGQVIGVLEVHHYGEVHPDPEWREFLLAVAEQAAIGIENVRLFQDLQRSNDELAIAYDATIEGWVHALDLRDHETEGHTQRVTELTLRLARAMGLPDAELVHLRRGALLHDIGKMGVPDAILRKPGPLTPEERALMEQHTTWAYEWLSPIRYLRTSLDIPYCHHEKWDGTGYPRGLRGEQIPLAARIFAAVDIYDALRSARVYRPAWPEGKVIDHIRHLSGSHLDPRVVDAFLAMVGGARLRMVG